MKLLVSLERQRRHPILQEPEYFRTPFQYHPTSSKQQQKNGKTEKPSPQNENEYHSSWPKDRVIVAVIAVVDLVLLVEGHPRIFGWRIWNIHSFPGW